MFRELIPALADKFHLIAPDYIGFGHSDAPSRSDFEYTFDNLATHVRGLLDQLGLTSYVLYMQDYGGPVGFRLFAEKPEQVKGFIIQNANAYMEGVGDAPKKVLMPLWEKRTPETEKPAREFVSLEGTKFHWLVGAKDPEAINPDNWILDQALLDRPGVQDYQVDLLENYKSNIALYPDWQAAFLAALMLFSYYGSALIQGKNPFAPYGDVANRVTFGQPAAHSAPARKHIHKPNPAKPD
jgi:pimeloyl-ACP methyl ester carboxylesterase